MRTNNVNSILLCLKMIEKLMNSNPQTYTLPLMREGVTTFIKKISTSEQLEKTLGVSLTDPEKAKDGDVKSEEFLAKAR